MKRTFSLFICVGVLAIAAVGQEMAQVDPAKAFEMTKAPSTYLVDVRSAAEYHLVGHPPMAFNVPLSFWSETERTFTPNPNFIDDLKSRFKSEDTLLFICRAGGRSLRAAQAALKAGFAKSVNVVQGFEGEKDENGLPTKSGWKNAGLPYTYAIDPALAYAPKK
jgi:rhodanese-related sulfurtransferase